MSSLSVRVGRGLGCAFVSALVFIGCSSDSDSPGEGNPSAASGGSGGSGAAGSGGEQAGGSSGEGNGSNTTGESLMADVERTRLVDDVTYIAQERVPGSEHWQAVQDLCAARFAEYGFDVELHDYGTGVNVIGRKPGNSKATEDVIVSGHYDHIAGCPGASDNAAGTAATLEIARILGAQSFARSLVVACWDQEEIGLVGSRAYATRANDQSENIKVVYSLDGMGYTSDEPNSQTVPAGFDALFVDEVAKLAEREYRGDFVAIIADASAEEAANHIRGYAEGLGLQNAVLKVSAALKNQELLRDLRRSDHASFWMYDIPAIQLADTSNFRNPNYHCLNGVDEVSTVDFDFVTNVTKATLGSAADMLELE
jgi:hypothetical protein